MKLYITASVTSLNATARIILFHCRRKSCHCLVVLINTSFVLFALFMTSCAALVVSLTTEAVQGAALALEGVDDVKSGDGLAAGVLGVSDSITDDVFKEDLEHTTSFLVDKARNALDTTTASETANGGLSYALDVVTKDLSVALCAALSETLSSFSAARHCC
jgi:hypothetical protein